MVEFFAAEPRTAPVVQVNQAFGNSPAPVGYVYPAALSVPSEGHFKTQPAPVQPLDDAVLVPAPMHEDGDA